MGSWFNPLPLLNTRKASTGAFNQGVLLISSKDDPFLAKECYPYKEAKESSHFHLEVTKYGGHVGFISGFLTKNNRWLENRILEFIKLND